MTATDTDAHTHMMLYLLRALAIDFAMDVLPTPGGPTNVRILPLIEDRQGRSISEKAEE